MSGPYHSSINTQLPLASGATEDRFQDRSPCVEIYPWLGLCESSTQLISEVAVNYMAVQNKRTWIFIQIFSSLQQPFKVN